MFRLFRVVYPIMQVAQVFFSYVEKLFYASFVILWLAVKVEPQLLPLWLVSNSVIGLLFLAVVINEVTIYKVNF